MVIKNNTTSSLYFAIIEHTICPIEVLTLSNLNKSFLGPLFALFLERATWSGKTREPEKSTRKRPDRARPETVLEPTGRPDRARSNLKSTWCNSPDILWQTGKPEEYLVLLLL